MAFEHAHSNISTFFVKSTRSCVECQGLFSAVPPIYGSVLILP